MKVSDFNYDLPKELIAQVPIKQRDTSRLLVLDRENKRIEHKIFKDILDYLKPGDCLVRNNTKVLPARIYGKKVSYPSHFYYREEALLIIKCPEYNMVYLYSPN